MNKWLQTYYILYVLYLLVLKLYFSYKHDFKKTL